MLIIFILKSPRRYGGRNRGIKKNIEVDSHLPSTLQSLHGAREII